jgi:hypothetical protein
LFEVSSIDSPVPYEGLPPSEAYTEQVSIKEAADPAKGVLNFNLTRPSGFYYLDIGVIAYFEAQEKVYAQVEHFFPLVKATEVQRNSECQVALRPEWPNIPMEDLGTYGTIRPGGEGQLDDA